MTRHRESLSIEENSFKIWFEIQSQTGHPAHRKGSNRRKYVKKVVYVLVRKTEGIENVTVLRGRFPSAYDFWMA